jgi:hypothetical protein
VEQEKNCAHVGGVVGIRSKSKMVGSDRAAAIACRGQFSSYPMRSRVRECASLSYLRGEGDTGRQVGQKERQRTYSCPFGKRVNKAQLVRGYIGV